jgi:hypothetical protein
MKDFTRKLSKCLAPVILAVSCVVAADTQQLNQAVNKYYAGFTDEAIDMIEPLARAGDVDAQYLLGNILYSLSNTGKFDEVDDSVKWYKMAAAQKSLGANYALGAVFHNRWLKSRKNGDAAMAIVYYQNAVDLGYKKAQTPLTTILSRSRVSRQQAETLVKQQEADPATESTAVVQPIVNQPIVNQPMKPIADETPSVETAREQTTSSESTPVDAPISDTPGSEVPMPVAKIPTPETMPETSDAVAEAETVSADPVQAAPPVIEPRDEAAMTLTLTEFVDQCANYTEVGFGLYAQTIKGAVLSGKAPVVEIEADSSDTDSYSIALSAGEVGTEVLVNLHEVPKEVATRYKPGDKYPAMGIVVDSKLSGSRCVVSLTYQAEL